MSREQEAGSQIIGVGMGQMKVMGRQSEGNEMQ